MEKKKGLLPLILPLIFPRGWPVCFASCAFRGGPRVVGPSGLRVASGPLWWLSRGFFRGFGFSRFPSLEAWFSFGLFRAFDRAKIPPTFHGFFHGKRQILGPEKQSQKQSQKDEKRGFLCAILCARKPPSSPWSGGIFQKVEGPLFAGGLPVGRGQTRGKKAPPAFYSTSGKT